MHYSRFLALLLLGSTGSIATATASSSEPAILGYVDGDALEKVPEAFHESLQPTSEVTINATLLEAAAPPPDDVDISRDHELYSYNMLRNTSWSLAMRSSGPVWVHESRISTVEVTPRATHLEGRSQANYWYSSAPSRGSSCPPRNNQLRNGACVT